MGEYLRDSGLRVQAIPEQLELVERRCPAIRPGKILKHTLRETYPAGRHRTEGKP